MNPHAQRLQVAANKAAGLLEMPKAKGRAKATAKSKAKAKAKTKVKVDPSGGIEMSAAGEEASKPRKRCKTEYGAAKDAYMKWPLLCITSSVCVGPACIRTALM